MKCKIQNNGNTPVKNKYEKNTSNYTVYCALFLQIFFRVCLNPNTNPELSLKQDKRARDPNTTPQHETEHIYKRARSSRALSRKQEKKGVSGLCHKIMNKLDWSDRTLTEGAWFIVY